MRREPLSFYIDKLRRGEPFTSLLYGDGEFIVAAGQRQGVPMQNGEMPTPELRDETLAGLSEPGADILRGTDPHLIEYDTYQGQDRKFFVEAARGVEHLFKLCPVWYDGTVWETACQEGKLGPLLAALRERDVIFVGNGAVCAAIEPLLRPRAFVAVPGTNACAVLDAIESEVLRQPAPPSDPVFVVCMGLGTVSLLLRLRRRQAGATFLDLGSTFDLFARIGSRGWQQELYLPENEGKWRDLVRRNLEVP